mmetsp:Transcript_3295/g.5267  ORF Transcript_3295/g.5267 Transcript_3295/m.5267 type:complete len:146 (-) Transcript_3295:192-629(-)|eukprot:jgi/Bigna1/83946/fgenesh1_pg.119_\
MCALHCCVCDVLRHRHLTWLRRRFPNQKVGLIWDMAPGHTDRRVMEHISKARLQGWLKVGLIPGGSTSITQPCDLVANAPLKKKMKCWHSRWKNQKLVDLQSSKGHVNSSCPEQNWFVDQRKQFVISTRHRWANPPFVTASTSAV